MKCNQKPKCDNEAAYRFTWPGQDESVICAEHAPKLRGVANALGMHLQLVPLEPEEVVERCESGCEASVTHHDDEGIPLCDECWEDLVQESEAAPDA